MLTFEAVYDDLIEAGLEPKPAALLAHKLVTSQGQASDFSLYTYHWLPPNPSVWGNTSMSSITNSPQSGIISLKSSTQQ